MKIVPFFRKFDSEHSNLLIISPALLDASFALNFIVILRWRLESSYCGAASRGPMCALSENPLWNKKD